MWRVAIQKPPGNPAQDLAVHISGITELTAESSALRLFTVVLASGSARL